VNACEEKCGVRCTCRDGVMCDDCVRIEIDRLDAHYDDGRKGYVCDRCGSPAWEPQGGTTCADCLEPSAEAAPTNEAKENR
jgi:hypothetical protein